MATRWVQAVWAIAACATAVALGQNSSTRPTAASMPTARGAATMPAEIEVVEYPRSSQWVGDLKCPRCEKLTPGWRSSEMSESFPHFYCDRCSNVILRHDDRDVMHNNVTRAALDKIAATLPDCPCGGHFRPGANPKCRHCGAEIPNAPDPVKRLEDGSMIVVDGACAFIDQRPPYRVRIVDGK